MIEKTVSSASARRFYNLLGGRYDLFEFYESGAKVRARDLLALAPGERFLNIGIGTGKDHLEFIRELAPGGIAFGLDLSPVMSKLAHQRTGAPVVEADSRFVPFSPESFDVVYAAYVLDLIPAAEIPGVLEDCARILAPGGRLLLLSLTEGVDFASRGVVAAWKFLYSFAPMACGGCRPLVLSDWVQSAGFVIQRRETVVQWGVPSEILLARRDEDASHVQST